MRTLCSLQIQYYIGVVEMGPIDKLLFMQSQARKLTIRAMQGDVLDSAAAHSKVQCLVCGPVFFRGTNEVAPLGQLPPFTSLEPKATLICSLPPHARPRC